MAERPSFLEVDTLVALGDARALEALREDPEWDEHLAATVPPAIVPTWALALAEPPARRAWRRWLVAGALLAALALLLLRPEPPYVGRKGTASALLYVERAGVVTPWDGQRPLLAGDRFRVELSDLGAPYHALLYEEPGEPPIVLATGASDGLLPGAWTFDAPAAGGRLLVVGLRDDPAGLSGEALLQTPPVIVLPLR